MLPSPIDIHDPAGEDLQWLRRVGDFCYDIPYGVMLPKGSAICWLQGGASLPRTEALAASARISATAMALGQAAGTAAVLSLSHKNWFLTSWTFPCCRKNCAPGRHSHKGRPFVKAVPTPREAVYSFKRRSENWLNEHFTLAGECVPPAILNRQAVLAASGQRKPGF